MITKENLIELVELSGQHAHTILVGLQKELMPTWLYINAKSEAIIAGTPWANAAEKKQMVRQLRMEMLLQKAVAYSLVVEAWSSEAPKGWKIGDKPIAASEQPNRREVVIAFATNGQDTEWKRWAIRRNEAGRVLGLDEESMKDAEKIQSWMTKLIS